MDVTNEELLACYARNGNNAAATARELGWKERTTRDRLRQLSGDTGQFVVTGRSTLRNAAGEVVMEWEKTNLDRQAEEDARKAAYAAMAEKLPRVEPVRGAMVTNAQLCTVYTITDAHVGALAWHREGGADWDLNIAERILTGCFESMIASAPYAKIGIINQLGDMLHFDGLSAVTPTSGHLLDADGRFAKVVEVAIRVLRRIIAAALEKHERVHVILAEGNHDLSSSVWLRVMFAALYENEPRVTVDDSALPYYVFQHGKTMLAFHHGHLKKNDALPLLFAAQFSKMWGETTKRYCHTGHRHHVEEKEHAGMVVTQHPTLAARDAYAARGGWISERSASAITYHARFGEVGRVTISPEMLEAA